MSQEETKVTTSSAVTTAPKKKSNTILIIIVVVIALLAVCGFVGRQLLGVAFKGFLSSKGLDVDTKSGDVTIKTDDGTVTFDGDSGSGLIKTDKGEFKYGEDISLPSDFPSNIPVFTGAKIITASSKTEEGATYLSFTSDKSVQTVIDFYKTELPKLGWTLQSELVNSMVTYENATQILTVFVSADNDKNLTSAMITTGNKE